MRNLSAAAACVASVVVAAGALMAQVPRLTVPGVETMDVDDVRPGMRGYGLTVFRGTRPERFDVEVLDTIHNFRPHMDLVLIRPTHPTLEHAGTVGGMSGSPIFIEGKLIGAYAYGWEFGRDPVAGVTPIASMLAELRRPRRTPSGIIPGSGIPFDIGPTPITSPRARWESLSQSALAHRTPVSTAYGSLVPAMTPMAVTGMGVNATRHLAEALEPFGIVPLQGAGGGGTARPADDAPRHYENGGAIGVRMIQGDISGNVTGTVTLVTPEGVLAFGHPMMGLGETAFPATLARVMWILASERRSFKISEPVRSLGALVNDRGSAVVVDSRASAPTIPMRVSIHGVPGARSRLGSTRRFTASAMAAVSRSLCGWSASGRKSDAIDFARSASSSNLILRMPSFSPRLTARTRCGGIIRTGSLKLKYSRNSFPFSSGNPSTRLLASTAVSHVKARNGPRTSGSSEITSARMWPTP